MVAFRRSCSVKVKEIFKKYAGKMFKRRENMNCYKKTTRNPIGLEFEANDTEVYAVDCFECDLPFKYISNLRSHLINEHQFIDQVDILDFQNEEDFINWRTQEEKSTHTHYIQKSIERHNKTSYFCSGSHIAVSDTVISKRPRRFKIQDDCKIPYACTSRMIVRKLGEGFLKVVYYKTHYHYAYAIMHQRFVDHLKNDIIVKLSGGITVRRILHIFPLSNNCENSNEIVPFDLRLFFRHILSTVGGLITGNGGSQKNKRRRVPLTMKDFSNMEAFYRVKEDDVIGHRNHAKKMTLKKKAMELMKRYSEMHESITDDAVFKRIYKYLMAVERVFLEAQNKSNAQ